MTSGATGAGQSSGITAGVISDPRQADGIQSANDVQDRPSKEDEQKERGLVEKKWKEYDKAREFDSNFRKQVAIDRRYAAGTSDLSWAVTTNLIGAFIDILVALLYARDPDVSVRKAPQVDESNTHSDETFARTLEIVISKLWVKGNLKKQARKGVRSVLSNSEGWLKCHSFRQESAAGIEAAINDAQETL